MYLSSTLRDNKYVIAHEFGHAVWDEVAGVDEEADSDADPGACFTVNSNGSGHEKNSKEFQSRAIAEGWAHFYAAVAFNVSSDSASDCAFRTHTPVDWNLLFGTTDNDMELDCKGSPDSSVSIPFSYLEAKCLGSGDPGHNRGNEWDWLRALWKVDEELSFYDLTEIWAGAGVDSWDIDGDDAWDCGTAACDDQPYTRLRDALIANTRFDAADLAWWDFSMALFGTDR